MRANPQADARPARDAQDRHQNILELLKTENRVSVESLAARLGVSAVTIRKDLGFLDEQGLVGAGARRRRLLPSQPLQRGILAEAPNADRGEAADRGGRPAQDPTG